MSSSILPLAIPTRKKRKPPTVSKLRKQVDTNRQGQEGVAWVRWIVEGLWGCGLEIISANNDDGVDAIILLKRRRGISAYSGPTGDLIFAQIKTGYRNKVPTKDYALTFDPDSMARWRSRWAAYPGPAVMINVIPKRLTKGEPKAFWTDLKKFSPANPQTVQFSFEKKFDGGAKSNFYNLCWRWAEFRQLPLIQANESLDLLDGKKSLREVARDYYKKIKEEAKGDPGLFQAAFTWQGWDHITRTCRPTLTKQQSLQLLPIVAAMLRKKTGLESNAVTGWKNLPQDGQTKLQRYEALTTRVLFYERHEAVVRVIIQRTQLWSRDKLTYDQRVFYSAYEVARRKKSH
jgi:hypothetical protein